MPVVRFWLKMDFQNTLNGTILDLLKIAVGYAALKHTHSHSHTHTIKSLFIFFYRDLRTQCCTSLKWAVGFSEASGFLDQSFQSALGKQISKARVFSNCGTCEQYDTVTLTGHPTFIGQFPFVKWTEVTSFLVSHPPERPKSLKIQSYSKSGNIYRFCKKMSAKAPFRERKNTFLWFIFLLCYSD